MGVAKTNQNQMVQTNMGIPLVNPLEWKPDYCQIEKWLYGKEECPFNNPVLKNIWPGVKFCVSDIRQSQEWHWKVGRILA